MSNRKMKKRWYVLIFLSCFFLPLLLVWCAMQYSTNSVIESIENAFYSDIYYILTPTDDERSYLEENHINYVAYTPDDYFNDYEIHFAASSSISVENYVNGYTIENVDFHRSYALHNFKEGYLWLLISYTIIDVDGDVIYGEYDIPVKIHIHKVDGQWEIVDFYEPDFFESDSERIQFYLPEKTSP